MHLLTPKDEYTPFLLGAGFNWHQFKLSRKGLNIFQEIQSLVLLNKKYKNIQPDLVFNFTPKCVLYGSFIAKKMKIPSIVNTITGLGYLFSGRIMRLPIIRWIIRLIYRSALNNTKVIFQNPEDKNEFINSKIISEEQSYIVRGSGVDINRFFPVKEREGTPIVVLPSRLIKEKGVFDFIDAVRILQSLNVNARFALVGNIDYGNPSAMSDHQIQEWVNEGVVEWWGWRSDMEKVFQESHLICLPTYYREGVPKTLLEAAACGRAIIATDTPGCKEIVINNENGILITPRNSKMLAEAIHTLLLDPDRRKKLGLMGRVFVEENFRNDLIISEIKKIVGL